MQTMIIPVQLKFGSLFKWPKYFADYSSSSALPPNITLVSDLNCFLINCIYLVFHGLTNNFFSAKYSPIELAYKSFATNLVQNMI